MSTQTSEKPKSAVQVEEVAKKYADIREKTENEIAKIKDQLLSAGVPGSTIVKLKPIWHNDVDYLLGKESERLGKAAS